MAVDQAKIFVRQVRALTKKTLFLLVVRHWFSTLLQAVIFPIGILLIVLNSRYWGGSSDRNGIGSPAPIQTLRQSIPNKDKLVLVRPPALGSDVDTVLRKITEPLSDISQQVIRIDSPDEVLQHCSANSRGVSGCYAAIVFEDSPLTEGGNHTWTYTIRIDPIHHGYKYDAESHHNDADKYYFPIQLALDNAITNSTDIPNTYMFTDVSQKEKEEWDQQMYMEDVITILVILFYISNLVPIGHIVTTVTNERAKGLSTLIDAMGGGVIARVASSIISFWILYLPVWIVSGILYWHYLFPKSNAGLLILWNILFGWSLTNASIMAAAFFKGNRISGICVAIGFTAPAAGAAVLLNRQVQTSAVLGYSFVFPTMNFIFSLSTMARHQIAGKPIDLGPSIPPKQTVDDYFKDSTYHVSLGTLFGFLALQIIFYPLLAILVEKFLHGINLRHRVLTSTEEAKDSPVALELTNLKKVYHAPWYKLIFCRGKKVLALDGLSLTAQKNQILCLLGVNGSGKTTTLDLISGFQAPTVGDIKINTSSTSLGVCPQKNVLFSRLTVYEHVKFWSDIKGGAEDPDVLRQLIDACDLTKKMNSRASNLSGGQKRKLQLACMFVGGSSVCLMDEVTTGLDPLSRRVIWNIIRAERSKRSMVFTTHFLDEGEVLADHIVILSKGQIMCQGSSAELKNQFGGGYQVHIPGNTHAPDIGMHATSHQDRLVYTVPDSQLAGQLVRKLEESGVSEVEMTGPTIEDVFLNLTTDAPEQSPKVQVPEAADATGEDSSTQDEFTKVSRDPYSFGRQVLVLFRKRCTVLIRYWMAPILCLLIPIVVTPQLKGFLYRYKPPSCGSILVDDYDSYKSPVSFYNSYYQITPVGPSSYNGSLFKALKDYPIGLEFNISMYNDQFAWFDTFEDFQAIVPINRTDIYPAAIWFGDSSSAPTIPYPGGYGIYAAVPALNIYSQVKNNMPIKVSFQDFPYTDSGEPGSSLQYVLYICVLFTVYPAFFALYPAYEKVHQIRSLQYSNGVRPLPLWTAHLLFDLIFVLIIALAVTLEIQSQYSLFWFEAGYLFPVFLLYGIAGCLVAYTMAVLARSQFAAFLYAIGVLALQFLLVALSMLLLQGYVDPSVVQSTTDAVTFSLGLIFPIMNVFKALAVGLNLFKVTCRGDQAVTYAGSIYAYGGPILILCIQILLSGLLLILTDRDLSIPAIFKRQRKGDMDEAGLAPNEAISDEVIRVKQTESDLLRLLHVSKSFKSTVAVDDVSLGLGQGEILALLGPNGAGKTTIVNMIRGEFRPDSGKIFLKDVDVHRNTRLAQRYLGVCPQFDALDLLTARQHLKFYARIKGVRNISGAVNSVMAKVGLTPHASKAASKLSGGNKRKLSLGIALMGNPDVLLLDEPSSSMDAAAKRAMWKILADIAPGRSLLLTTHSMEEADTLATRAAIVSKKLLAIGTTQVLRQKYSNLYHVQLVLESAPSSNLEEMLAVEQWIREHFDGVTFEGQSLGGQVKFMIPNNSVIVGAENDNPSSPGIQPIRGGEKKTCSVIAHLIETLEANKESLGLTDYSIGAPTLEQVFLSVVKDNEAFEEEKKSRWWSWML